MKKFPLAGVVIALAASVGVQGIAAQELLVNGSLENTSATFVPDGNGIMQVSPGTTIPGWTVTDTTLLWATTNVFVPKTPFGDFAVDLTGYQDNLFFAGISQTIPTVPNSTYRLTFWLGAYQDNPIYAGPMGVSATAGSTSNSFTFAPTGSGAKWGRFWMNFSAISNFTTISIRGALSGGGDYLGLDNVSVMNVTNLPALVITNWARSGSNLQLTHTSEAGFRYAVQSRTNLVTGNWATVPNSTNLAVSDLTQIVLTNAVNGGPHQFYRIWQLP